MKTLQSSNSLNKVLLASHHASLRGSAISLVELGRRLPEHGYDPVFVFSKPGPLAEDLKSEGYSVYCVPRTGMFRLSTLWRIRQIIRQHDISLAHVNSAVAYSKYIALTARLCGIPVIWHVREPIEDKRLARQRPWIRYLADKIIVLTRQQGDFINAPEKTMRVFNGVDCNIFSDKLDRETIRASLGLAQSDFVFIQVGSIEPNKGQTRSIYALEALLPSHSEVKLLIVGNVVDQREMFEIQKYMKAHSALERHVLMVGERTDIPQLLSASDCLLLPSLRESFSRTLMEAMSCGRPVIATRVGAAEDMIASPREGFLVPPGNVQALREAMHVLVTGGHACAQNMGRMARFAALSRFDIQKHVDTIAKLYTTLLETPRNQV